MSNRKTIEGLDEAEGYFSEAYDRLMAGRVVYEKISGAAEECLAYAKPILALVKNGRVKVDGETMKGIEISVALVEADYAHAKSSLAKAEEKALGCASILRRLDLYIKTGASTQEHQKWSSNFSDDLWLLTTSVRELQVLHAQIEVCVATLDEKLPL